MPAYCSDRPYNGASELELKIIDLPSDSADHAVQHDLSHSTEVSL